MKRNYQHNWDDALVNLSKTDHIYDLIMCEGIYPHFRGPNHEGDFVIINTGRLPEKLSLSDVLQDSIAWPYPSYSFEEEGYVLMQTLKLTPYLEAAVSMHEVEDKNGANYIELRFLKPEKKQTRERSLSEYLQMVTDHREKALIESWQLFASVNNKVKALELARLGQSFLEEQKQQFIQVETSEIDAEALWRWQTGHHIVASVYCWNNLFEEAQRIEKNFMQEPVWNALYDMIGGYLELLIAKDRREHLRNMFGNIAFRKQFIHHYEVYVSLFFDETFPLTNTMMAVPIFNRVNQIKTLYQ